MSDDFESVLTDIVSAYSVEKNTDVLLYCGPLENPHDDTAIDCIKNPKFENAILLLTTFGGSAHAAYRIARRLQKCYKSFTVYIYTQCKSAGTLLALGANELIMSDYAEMGPLDVQLRKSDELGEYSSGLTITQSLSSLQTEAFSMFEDYFLRLRYSSGLQITTKTAAEIAANLTIGLFKPIYNQVDPLRIGETDRAVRISMEYGDRIGKYNLKPNALVKLVSGYPDHNFVIDRTEAKELFNRVREPSEAENKLANHLHGLVEDMISKNKTLVINLTSTYYTDDDKKKEVKKNDQDREKELGNGDGDEKLRQTSDVPNNQIAEEGSDADHKDKKNDGKEKREANTLKTVNGKRKKAVS